MLTARRAVAGACFRLGQLLLRVSHRLQAPPRPAPTTYPNPRFDPARHAARVRQFQETNLHHLLLDFDLNETSVVFDIGGYEGDFAANMFCRYLSTVHVFEVLPSYCEHMRRRFVRNPKVHVHDFGLAAATREDKVFPAAAGSSMLLDRFAAGEAVSIRLVRADDFLRSAAIHRIDLMKINIEGAEYELLEHLLDTGWPEKIDNVLVQLHEEMVPDAETRMRGIQERLARTHESTFRYDFVWENWRRKSS